MKQRMKHLLACVAMVLLLAACGSGNGSSSYTVTPTAGTGGSISPATAQPVSGGGTASFTLTPATGYAIATVTGCGGTLSGNSYTTGTITADCTVTASFSRLSYTVTPTAGSGGSISPAAGQTIGYGGTTSFTVTPDSGYAVGVVSGCNGTLSGSAYTTGPITADCSVTANFSQLSYTVTPSAGTGGSISPAAGQTIGYGGTTSFTLTPATGYAIGTVTGCGGTLSGNSYTTGAITGDCTVTASFSQLSYTVTPSAGTGGSISPAAGQTIGYGGTTSFTLTPATGYAIGTVTGCGGTLSGNSYTTGPVTGNCTVTANFTPVSGSLRVDW